MEAAIVNSVIYRPAPACARHARNKFAYCLILWVTELVAIFFLTSLQHAIGADFNPIGNNPTIKTSLSGIVYFDKDKDGNLDQGRELAIAGAKIEFFNNDTNTLLTTTVNSVGQYSFTDIGPGNYSLYCTTTGNWTPILGSISGMLARSTSDISIQSNNNEWGMGNIQLYSGDIASNFNFAATSYPIGLLSKRLLLASSAPQIIYAIPEPSTLAMLIVAAFAIGVSVTGRRYFNR